MLDFAVLLLIRCSNGRVRSRFVVNKFELSCGHLSFTSTILTFKLPFGRPIDAIHIRSDSSVGWSASSKYENCAHIIFWLRLIACFARALALCLKVNGKTQWIEHQTPDMKKKNPKGQTLGRCMHFRRWKSITFTKLIFNHLSFSDATRARQPLETQFISLSTCRGGRSLHSTIFRNISIAFMVDWSNCKCVPKRIGQIKRNAAEVETSWMVASAVVRCTTQDSLRKTKTFLFFPQDWSISSSSELIEIRYDMRSTQCR